MDDFTSYYARKMPNATCCAAKCFNKSTNKISHSNSLEDTEWFYPMTEDSTLDEPYYQEYAVPNTDEYEDIFTSRHAAFCSSSTSYLPEDYLYDRTIPKYSLELTSIEPEEERVLSPLKIFDAAATAELQKLRTTKVKQIHPLARKMVQDTRAASSHGHRPWEMSQNAFKNGKTVSNTSWMEAGDDARREEPDSAFHQAMEKLARAEAACHFDGAARAAEEAAASAPPELKEEAAMLGARNYRAVVMDTFKGTLPGPKPIEVLGYIGVTGPK